MRISDWSSDVCSSDLDPGEKARKEVVDPNRQVREVVQFFLARPAEAGDVLVRNQRIAQRVVLVIIFKDGAREDGAFRSEERRGGKEGGSTCRSRWSP